jgi:menaquinone-dependent protoporphyrinogen oxidase
VARRPTALGPIGDPPQPTSPDRSAIATIVAAAGAGEHRVFGGKLDKSEVGLNERAAVRFVGAPDGDNRDRAAIRDWAGEIAHELPTP